MKDYSQGKVYRILSKTGKQYVGSTVVSLSRRMTKHRGYLRDPTNQGISSVELLKEDPDAKIILIENYPCSNSEELRAREQYWIENIEGGCVNKQRAHITPELTKQKAKEREEKNKEKIKYYRQDYFQRTYEPSYYMVFHNLFQTPEEKEEHEEIQRQKKRECDRQYREEHKEEIREYQRTNEEQKQKARERVKRWTEENKERSDAWKKEKITCECGSVVCRSAFSTHRRSEKHRAFEAMKK